MGNNPYSVELGKNANEVAWVLMKEGKDTAINAETAGNVFKVLKVKKLIAENNPADDVGELDGWLTEAWEQRAKPQTKGGDTVAKAKKATKTWRRGRAKPEEIAKWKEAYAAKMPIEEIAAKHGNGYSAETVGKNVGATAAPKAFKAKKASLPRSSPASAPETSMDGMIRAIVRQEIASALAGLKVTLG